MLYVRLGLSNIKKFFKDYTVYFITLILAVSLFYSFNTMDMQSQFLSMESQKMAQGCESVIRYITIFVAIVLGSLMVYANNYLIKRRKRELGLYQVLGMRKIQVSNILVIETLAASIVSFVVGIVLGIFISQLMVFLTASFFRETIVDFKFIFSTDAFLLTLKSFGLIFLVMLLFNLKALNKVELVDLMGAHRKNESFRVKNGYLSLVLFFVSLTLIGWSYARLMQHGYEVLFGVGVMNGFLDVLKNRFFQTTLIMLIGTILFFYSVSSAYLKLSQVNKRRFYRGLNMFTTRQLSAKAATVTGTMTVIALLLFFSISTITFGMSLAGSMEHLMSQNVPYDATYTFYNHKVEEDNINRTNPDSIVSFLDKNGINLNNGDFKYIETQEFSDKCFDEKYRISLQTLVDISGIQAPSVFDTATSGSGDSLRVGKDVLALHFMRESDYLKRCELLNIKPIKIGEGQYLICTNLGNDIPRYYDKILKSHTKLDVLGHQLTPAADSCITGQIAVNEQGPMGMNSGTIIVKDDVIPKETVPEATSVQINQVKDEDVDFDKIDTSSYYNDSSQGYLSICYGKACYLSTVGNLALISYISIYVGLVMVMAFGAIISIQQLSFAVDSQNSYRMLNTLGCPKSMVNKSLFRQVFIYFSLPLVVGFAHSFVALRVLFDDLGAVWPISLTSTAVQIISIFFMLYALYFGATYAAAKSIVNDFD